MLLAPSQDHFSRHTDISDHNVWLQFVDHCQASFAVFRRPDDLIPQTFPIDDQRQSISDRCFIVNDQHFTHFPTSIFSYSFVTSCFTCQTCPVGANHLLIPIKTIFRDARQLTFALIVAIDINKPIAFFVSIQPTQ